MVYRCNLCTGYLAVCLRQLLDHLRRSHSNDPNFHLLCGIEGCARTYKRFTSFRNHLIRKHSFKLKDDEENQVDNNEVQTIDLGDLNEPLIRQHDQPVKVDSILRDNALCLLGFKDKSRVPQTVVDLFVENSTQMVRNSIEIAKSEVKEKLNAAGHTVEDIPGLKEIFEEDSVVMNPLRGMETEQQQHKFYQTYFNLVVCLIFYFIYNILFQVRDPVLI